MASVEVAEERKIERPRSIRGLDVLCIAEGPAGRRDDRDDSRNARRAPKTL
jgi:hypothetical protein